MTTTPLLNDETTRARLLLQNAASTEVPLRETKAVAGCNCDRWGHPCAGCVHPNVQPNAEGSDFIASGEMSQDRRIADCI
jgi:hypothetical protein